jgi:predicted tellurium resistance membrane protein TerC
VIVVLLMLLAWPLIVAAEPAGHGAAVASGDLLSAAGLISLATLIGLEVVLGIDNVIFIAILAGRLPEAEQGKARRLGIAMAVLSRIGLLLGISWVMRLTEPLLTIGSWALSGKSLILLGGGLFLIAKSTYEIHDKLEGAELGHRAPRKGALTAVVLQIMVIDIVFSLDSVITAVGMTPHIPVMIVAVLVAGLMDGLGMSMLLSMLSLATRKPDHQPSLPEQVALPPRPKPRPGRSALRAQQLLRHFRRGRIRPPSLGRPSQAGLQISHRMPPLARRGRGPPYAGSRRCSAAVPRGFRTR